MPSIWIRQWFLNLVVEVNDGRILRFLELRFKAGDLRPIEAWQTLLLAFNHLQATPELVEAAEVSYLNCVFSMCLNMGMRLTK